MAKEKDEGEAGNLKHEAKGKQEGYTPKDVPVVKEAEDEKDSFKKGGRMKRAKGGRAEGKKPHHRLDKRASGGRMSGHSPLSSAASVKGRPGGDYDGSTDKEDD